MKNRLLFLKWWSALILLGVLSCVYYVLVGWAVWIVKGTFWDNWLDRLSFKIEKKIDHYEDLI